ncbi:MAG: hypothetical protein AAGD09_23775 [Cyanobacteria bacterium P01_F01_bin.56]
MYKIFFNWSQQNFVMEQQILTSSEPVLSNSGAWSNGSGYSPVEIILAISVLIGSIAGLIRVLIPVMVHSGYSSMPSCNPKKMVTFSYQNEDKGCKSSQ